MPVVRRYGQQQVATTALPRARRTAAHTAETLGADVERARGRRAEVVGAVGASLGSIGIKAYDAIKTKERARADEIAVLAAENAYAEFGQTELTSVLSMKGNDAFGAPEAFDKKISEFGQGVRKNLGTERQKQVFDRVFASRRLGWKLQVERHVAGEIQAFHTTEFIRGIEGDQREAIAFGGVGDFASANESLTRAVKRVQEHGDYLGMGPEAIKSEVLRVQSGTHAGIIDHLLANDNDRGARAYFEEANAEGQLQGDIVAALKAKLDTASTAADGMRAAESLWSQHGPKGETDPINLDVMETAAREQFKDDPKTLTATIQRLRERKAGVDDGRRERKEAVSAALWSAVASGSDLTAIQRMPQYLDAPGELQERVSAYVVREAEQRADRSYTLNERARTARERAKAERERKDMAAVWTAGDPLMVDAMTENQILSLLPDIGAENVRTLLAKKATFATPKAIQEAKIDEDLFKTVANGAGLPVYKDSSKVSDVDRAKMGHLRTMVEQAIDIEQTQHKRTLTRDEKQAVMARIVDARVMLDTFGNDSWDTDSRVASLMWNKAEAEGAYVPMDRIPATDVTAWVQVVRARIPAARNMSDDQIRSGYQAQIQRAYAAELMGLSLEEQRRRIEGGR